jgi:hypothetical protein
MHPPESVRAGYWVEMECDDVAVVSFQDGHGRWQSGCQRALEDLVAHAEIEPLGQGA